MTDDDLAKQITVLEDIAKKTRSDSIRIAALHAISTAHIARELTLTNYRNEGRPR